MTSTVYLCNGKRCKRGLCYKEGSICRHTSDIGFARNKSGPWTFTMTQSGNLIEVERKENAS